jgi:CRP-like cAMP-binding protein
LPLPRALSALADVSPFEPGELVFRNGSEARHVHFLAGGQVTLSRFGPRGEPVSIHVALAGEYFAEASLHSERYHCDAVVVQPAVVASIPSTALRELLQRDPEFALQWVAILSRQLRQTRARVERLSLKGAAERVRHLLLTEGKGAGHRYIVRGSFKDLAAELGLTHEALYRTLAAMEREGVVERNGSTIALMRAPSALRA